MKARDYFGLWVAGLLVVVGVAVFQAGPGYMDADYYYMGGLRLAQGFGFTEPVLWNYLGEPAGLPQPSHAYWMPLASLFVFAGIRLTGDPGFEGARILFLVVASVLPPLTAALGQRVTGQRGLAFIAGLLAVFSSFYLPFQATTDTFGLYMLLGALFFLALGIYSGPGRMGRAPKWAPVLLGGLAGLMHLARADGLLWLVIGAAGLIWASRSNLSPSDDRQAGQTGSGRLAWQLGLLVAGYLIVMGPWFARNLSVFGQPLAPGGSRALWLLDYDELFTYPPSQLTPARWWGSGVGKILTARLGALGLNLGNALAVQGQIFLIPLVLLGGWRLRRDLRVRLGLLAWGLTLISMTLLFPFPGSRGGFFHSGAAVQPLVWALAPVGLESFVQWGNRRRGWDVGQAFGVFGVGLVVMAFALSVVIIQRRVVGANPAAPAWAQSYPVYAGIDAALKEAGASEGEAVLINNPPGFYLASGRPAITIPDGDIAILRQAAARYQVDYLVLELNHPRPLDALYEAPGDRPGLVYLDSTGGTYIYYVEH